MNISKYITSIIFCSLSFSLFAQTNSDQITMKAMADEMKRSLNDLKLEKYEAPFFISIGINNYTNLNIEASLGALTFSNMYPSNSFTYNVKYGNMTLNDENFVSNRRNSSRGYLPLPLNADYSSTRRAIWSALDGTYKNAVITYSQKKQEIEQQNIKDSIPDFSEVPVVSYFPKISPIVYNQSDYEKLAKQLSAVYLKYPKLQTSFVTITGISSVNKFINSEGTKAIYPTNSIIIRTYAAILTADGEIISDACAFPAILAENLPKTELLIAEIEKNAKRLTEIANAPIIEDEYTGPVLFEQEAVADFVGLRLFSGTNRLIAKRTPIYAAEMKNTAIETNTFENRLNQRLFPETFSLKVYSRKKEYNGIQLAGAFEIDQEGVIPADELTLIENGKVINLLNNRTPSQKIGKSNGYSRFKGNGSGMMAPGTVEIKIAEGKTPSELKSDLLAKAKENGLEYAYIVRNLSLNQNSSKPTFKTVATYKVDVNTGVETLVRSGEIKAIPESALKTITASKDQINVYNKILSYDRTNVPVSYILPQSLLFEELEITKQRRSVSTAIPPVKNPLEL